ncbi:hypothetical protein HN903_02225 [archaeon]|jgi:hypothetical protein|nr:hypothetical protein [archaeon]MBT7128549.1 hypothetical protein [archaeon]
MKIINLIEELQETQHYKMFQQQNTDSYFSAAFLILNLEDKTEQIQLDYFLPQTKQIAAFAHPWTEPKIHDDIISVKEGKTEPKKIEQMKHQTTEIKIDIDSLESECKKLIKENNSSIAPTKIITILKDDIWNLTCMDNMLGIVRIKINAISEELIDFNKGGLMDFMGIKKQ